MGIFNASLLLNGHGHPPFFISKLKLSYDKYSVDKVWTKIYCHFYFRAITLSELYPFCEYSLRVIVYFFFMFYFSWIPGQRLWFPWTSFHHCFNWTKRHGAGKWCKQLVLPVFSDLLCFRFTYLQAVSLGCPNIKQTKEEGKLMLQTYFFRVSQVMSSSLPFSSFSLGILSFI